MKNSPKLEPSQSRNLINENDKSKSESELEMELEQHISPESVFNFVRNHYMNDDGNDSPPTGAELEESFRSYIYQLGYRGPKVEMFIQRAMSSIDDYDYSDKFDNINQIEGSSYGRKVFDSEIDNDIMSSLSSTKWEDSNENKSEPELGSRNSLRNQNEPTFRQKHKNNPFYIDPFSGPDLRK